MAADINSKDIYKIFFSVENLLLAYEFNYKEYKLERILEEDLLSMISSISYEEESHQIYVSLENRELWRTNTVDLKFTKLTVLPREAVSMSSSPRYICFLFENSTIMVRDLTNQDKVEPLSVSLI